MTPKAPSNDITMESLDMTLQKTVNGKNHALKLLSSASSRLNTKDGHMMDMG